MGRDDGRVHRIDTSSTKELDSTISRKSQDHHARFIDAIRWEIDDEMEQVEDRLRNWSRSRLLAHGVSLFDLKARSAGWMYGMRLLRLSMEKGGPMPSHRFKHGDIVLLSRNEPLGRQALEGVVARRSRAERARGGVAVAFLHTTFDCWTSGLPLATRFTVRHPVALHAAGGPG